MLVYDVQLYYQKKMLDMINIVIYFAISWFVRPIRPPTKNLLSGGYEPVWRYVLCRFGKVHDQRPKVLFPAAHFRLASTLPVVPTPRL